MQGHLNVEVPVKTDIQLLRDDIADLKERQDSVALAVNGLGANVQWIIDNVQGIFQMFGSPQMMSMLGPMMNGAMQAMPVDEAGDEDDD